MVPRTSTNTSLRKVTLAGSWSVEVVAALDVLGRVPRVLGQSSISGLRGPRKVDLITDSHVPAQYSCQERKWNDDVRGLLHESGSGTSAKHDARLKRAAKVRTNSSLPRGPARSGHAGGLGDIWDLGIGGCGMGHLGAGSHCIRRQ